MPDDRGDFSHRNYRVIRHVYEDGLVHHAIHEVYYVVVDGEERPIRYAENPSAAITEDPDTLQIVLQWMSRALDRPVLEASDFEEDE